MLVRLFCVVCGKFIQDVYIPEGVEEYNANVSVCPHCFDLAKSAAFARGVQEGQASVM